MGGPDAYSSRRRHHSRRAIASRTRPAAVAAAPAAAAATGVAAAATTGNAPRDAQSPPDRPRAKTQAPTTAPKKPARTEFAAPLPAPAPPQRNAALSAPENEPQARASASDQLRRLPNPRRAARPFRLGTVGPLAWPTAYEDVVGFTLWPKEYGERLRVHGIGDVLSTALAPSSSLAARTRAAGAGRRAEQRARRPRRAAASTSPRPTGRSPRSPARSILTTRNAARSISSKRALSDAVSSIKSNCRNDANLAPVERLRAMQRFALDGARRSAVDPRSAGEVL